MITHDLKHDASAVQYLKRRQLPVRAKGVDIQAIHQ